MAIQWRWDEKCGEATMEQTHDGETRVFTLSLYTGNCYLIFLHEFEDNGEQLYNLHSFWADKKHMETCLGLKKGTHNIYNNAYQRYTNFKLNPDKCRYWKQIAPALKKAFPEATVEIM